MTSVYAPISWSQQHRLGQSEQDAASGVYNPHHAACGYEVAGEFDVDLVENAWRRLTRRHPILTCRVDRTPLPGALISTDSAGEIDIFSVEDLANGDVRSALTRALALPFNLTSGPLCRLAIGTDRFGSAQAIGIAVEHLICDGWALAVLAGEFMDLLRSTRVQHAASDPSPTYARYIVEQNAYLKSAEGLQKVIDAARAMPGQEHAPSMPIRGYTPVAQLDYAANTSIVRTLGREVWSAIRELSAEASVSPFTTLHAALHWALGENSDQREVATTMSTSNRSDPQQAGTIGWLASKVVVTSRPGESAGKLEYLADFADAVYAALDLSSVPWPRLVYEVDASMLGRHATAPYVTFNAQPESSFGLPPQIRVGSSLLTEIPIGLGWHDASIATFWVERNSSIEVSIKWKSQIYEQRSIDRLWDSIVEILNAWTTP